MYLAAVLRNLVRHLFVVQYRLGFVLINDEFVILECAVHPEHSSFPFNQLVMVFRVVKFRVFLIIKSIRVLKEILEFRPGHGVVNSLVSLLHNFAHNGVSASGINNPPG
jgi:hypothetical protein